MAFIALFLRTCGLIDHSVANKMTSRGWGSLSSVQVQELLDLSIYVSELSSSSKLPYFSKDDYDLNIAVSTENEEEDTSVSTEKWKSMAGAQ